MIIRGISDKADQDKDKKYRVQPVKNAMLFLEKFLSFTNKSFEGDIWHRAYIYISYYSQYNA